MREYARIKRKVKAERDEVNERLTASLINGIRLSIRVNLKMSKDKGTSEDIVVNFTRAETDLIKNILKGGY